MNTEHTPSPWAIESNVIAGGVSHLAIVNRNNGAEWMVCSVTPMDKARPIDFINAKLLRAAPDLLKACKLIRGYMLEISAPELERSGSRYL